MNEFIEKSNNLSDAIKHVFDLKYNSADNSIENIIVKKTTGINELVDLVGDLNAEKGFHEFKNEINIPEINESRILLLVISELTEALEAFRINKFADINSIPDFPDFQDEDFKIEFQAYIKDTFEDEIADAIIRLLDLAYIFKIDIEKHIQLKLFYNTKRPYKHGKNF